MSLQLMAFLLNDMLSVSEIMFYSADLSEWAYRNYNFDLWG